VKRRLINTLKVKYRHIIPQYDKSCAIKRNTALVYIAMVRMSTSAALFLQKKLVTIFIS